MSRLRPGLLLLAAVQLATETLAFVPSGAPHLPPRSHLALSFPVVHPSFVACTSLVSPPPVLRPDLEEQACSGARSKRQHPQRAGGSVAPRPVLSRSAGAFSAQAGEETPGQEQGLAHDVRRGGVACAWRARGVRVALVGTTKATFLGDSGLKTIRGSQV